MDKHSYTKKGIWLVSSALVHWAQNSILTGQGHDTCPKMTIYYFCVPSSTLEYWT